MKYWTIRTCLRAAGQWNVFHSQVGLPESSRAAQSSPAARQREESFLHADPPTSGSLWQAHQTPQGQVQAEERIKLCNRLLEAKKRWIIFMLPTVLCTKLLSLTQSRLCTVLCMKVMVRHARDSFTWGWWFEMPGPTTGAEISPGNNPCWWPNTWKTALQRKTWESWWTTKWT